MTDTVLEGGCLCGTVRYRATGRPLGSAICHCRSCQRASGAPSVAWLTFRSAELSFPAQAPRSHVSSPGVTRSFCDRCGTPLTYRSDKWPDTVDVTTASLDAAAEFPPAKEIWLEHRLPWEPLSDDLPHYPRSSLAET